MSAAAVTRARRAEPPQSASALPGLAADEAGVAEHDGVWLAWRSYGPREAPPLLLVMGFMGSGRAWFRLLPHLAGRYRAIVFDNRGTGDSDRPLGTWAMRDLAGDALAVLDAAGVDTAHVVGASMGGMIAQELALCAPERVRSLTLCCTQAARRPGAPPWRMVASLLLRPLAGPARTFPIVAPLLYAERTRRERPERVREDLRLRFEDATPFGTAPAQAAAILRHDVRDRLRGLRVPALVIHGDEDRLIPRDAGLELAELIPGARLVVLPHTGHVLTTDSEERVAGELLAFLEEAS